MKVEDKGASPDPNGESGQGLEFNNTLEFVCAIQYNPVVVKEEQKPPMMWMTKWCSVQSSIITPVQLSMMPSVWSFVMPPTWPLTTVVMRPIQSSAVPMTLFG